MLMTQRSSVKISRQDHIWTADGYMLDKHCDELKEFFETKSKDQKTVTRAISEGTNDVQKKDEAISLTSKSLEDEHTYVCKNLLMNLNTLVRMYIKEYGLNTMLDGEVFYDIVKIQKTLPGEGYHLWHFEKGSTIGTANRFLAWTLYLNDIEEGGETEFLYQKLRVKPKKGRFAIWPAGFPYVHRGNPPLKDVKYIATSWIKCQYQEDKLFI